MRVEDEALLSRAVLGSAEARRALRSRRAAEPELAAEIERYEIAWESLELPPPAAAPAGFAADTAAAAAAERPVLPGFTLSPAWAGVAAAFLVAVGVLGGTGLGLYALPSEMVDASGAEPDETALLPDDGLLDEGLFDTDAGNAAAVLPMAGTAEVEP